MTKPFAPEAILAEVRALAAGRGGAGVSDRPESPSGAVDLAEFLHGFVVEADEHLGRASKNLLEVEADLKRGAAQPARRARAVPLAAHDQGAVGDDGHRAHRPDRPRAGGGAAGGGPGRRTAARPGRSTSTDAGPAAIETAGGGAERPASRWPRSPPTCWMRWGSCPRPARPARRAQRRGADRTAPGGRWQADRLRAGAAGGGRPAGGAGRLHAVGGAQRRGDGHHPGARAAVGAGRDRQGGAAVAPRERRRRRAVWCSPCCW